MVRQMASRALDVVILVVSLLYGLLFILSEAFARDAGAALERIDLVCTIILLSAFLAQLFLAHDRWRWLMSNWIDLVIVVLLAFPLLRVLRVHRYLPIARALRVTRLGLIMGEGVRAHLRSYGRGNIYNIVVSAVVVIVLAAVLIQFAEEGAREANIKSLGDAMWWAMTTVTTVGYGDRFPTTSAGRIVAGALMVLGIALFGVLTASLSSLFVAQARAPELTRLHAELQNIREEIAALRGAVAGGAAPPEREASPKPGASAR